MSLIQPLKEGNIDIIGDIHGEYEALVVLLHHLGYDNEGNHPDNRKLVFVGDLCDRGPDSPAVIKLVKKLIENKNAQAVLGNHELNLLQRKAKDGAGWYFDEQYEKDINYQPFSKVSSEEKNMIYSFLSTLPIALEREDLRIVHATWDSEKINTVREYKDDVMKVYKKLEKDIDESIRSSGLLDAYHQEQKKWEKEQVNPNFNIPFLEATSEYNLAHQMNNPIRVLTSGVEQKCDKPFFASGKWRFVERYSWWDKYQEDVPVVVGHFWRRFKPVISKHADENVFTNIEPQSWHGVKNNVFCVDFSVGGRFKERLDGTTGENTMLVALRWPERELVLENGEVLRTENFQQNNNKPKIK